jgi:hypothetical protein
MQGCVVEVVCVGELKLLAGDGGWCAELCFSPNIIIPRYECPRWPRYGMGGDGVRTRMDVPRLEGGTRGDEEDVVVFDGGDEGGICRGD